MNNTHELKSTLDALQSRSKQRVLSVEDIADLVEEAERDLRSRGLLKMFWKGVTASYDTDEYFPKSYTYPVSYTAITLKRFASGWFLIACQRDKEYGAKLRGLEVTVPVKSDEALKEHTEVKTLLRQVVVNDPSTYCYADAAEAILERSSYLALLKVTTLLLCNTKDKMFHPGGTAATRLYSEASL